MGIATVLITVAPEESEQAGPSRALYPKPFEIGQSLGRPGEADLQLQILKDALGLLKNPAEPGVVVTRDYS
jgi:D-proline reductase (dithiol) PrdB